MRERREEARVREIGLENLFATSHGRPIPRREYGVARECVEIASDVGSGASMSLQLVSRSKIWLYRTPAVFPSDVSSAITLPALYVAYAMLASI